MDVLDSNARGGAEVIHGLSAIPTLVNKRRRYLNKSSRRLIDWRRRPIDNNLRRKPRITGGETGRRAVSTGVLSRRRLVGDSQELHGRLGD